MAKIRRFFIFILVIVLIIAGLFLVGEIRSYTDYSIESSSEHVDTISTQYLPYGDHYFIKYGNDGITCIDAGENKLWNQSYEMDSPIVAIEGESVAVADRNGRQLYIFSKSGYQGKVDTIYSILQIDVAENGTTAAVLENEGLYYLALYDKTGSEIAKGTIHLENSGYPLSMALSNDGIKMAISFLSIASGKVTSHITIYNFDSVGRNEIDNIVTDDAYDAVMIPKIEFLDANTCIAFADDRILLYTGTQKPTLDKTIAYETEVTGIFYGPETFGIVTKNDVASASADAKGNSSYQITAYSKSGREMFSKGFDLAYNNITVLDNKEICVQSDTGCLIYSRYGLERFNYQFDEGIKLIRSTGKFETYDFVFATRTESVRLS